MEKEENKEENAAEQADCGFPDAREIQLEAINLCYACFKEGHFKKQLLWRENF